MIHPIRVFALVITLLAVSAPMGARAETRSVSHGLAQAQVRFQLHVTGKHTRGATYWVAYGPIGGHFGVIRLVRASSGLYTAVRDFPLGARGEFTYLAAVGQVNTPAGPAPARDIVTIRTTGIMSLRAGAVSTVTWSGPTG